MTQKTLYCNSCKISIANVKGSTMFSCPSCGKSKIVRCQHCKKIAAEYICPECNFTGPN